MAPDTVRLGVFAQPCKLKSETLKEILNGIRSDQISVIYFDESVTQMEVKNWPLVDVLLTFYSMDFPLILAKEYIDLNRPIELNHTSGLEKLRRLDTIYSTLADHDIPIPKYVVCDRSDGKKPVVEEFDDHVIINGQKISKPFEERHLDARIHDYTIYFPMSVGGGSQYVFHKTKDKQAVFNKDENNIKKNGTWIYIQYFPEQERRKIYCFGDYIYTEARKSVLAGNVQRDQSGKEIRSKVVTSDKENSIAKKVRTAFGQTICGIRIKRDRGQYYVSHVHSFDLIKNSNSYIDNAQTQLLQQLSLACQRDFLNVSNNSMISQFYVPVEDYQNTSKQLLGVIGIIRHGDRTPKQKTKFKVNDECWHKLFNSSVKPGKDEIKLKSPTDLKKVLENCNNITSSPNKNNENYEKIKTVLESETFNGFNRKIQLKKKDEKKFSIHRQVGRRTHPNRRSTRFFSWKNIRRFLW